MSLTRKLMLAVSLLVTGLLAGNLVVSVANARLYFSEQMQTLTEDAATSLGFSLSRIDLNEDKALAQSMVDAIFDGSYYRSIVVTDTNNQVVVARSRDISVDGVPSWFVNKLAMPQHAGVAEVVSGWYRMGEVTIIAHPGYLYRELWRVFKEQLWLFLFVAVLCYGLAGLGLKYILAPLASVQRQAEAISRKDFVEQETLPSTPELRRIVEAMNYMAKKIREMFQRQIDLTDSFRREASMDALTQLPVREEFNRQFDAWLKSQHGGGPGALLIAQIKNLDALNNLHGRESVNALLCGVAELFKQALGTWPRALASRRTGSDFVIFIPGLLLGELENFVKQFDKKIDDLFVDLQMQETEIFVGAVGSSCVEDTSSLLSAADAVLRQAITRVKPRWFIDSADNNLALCLTARAWVDRIKQAQVNKTLTFAYQPVFSTSKTVLNYEAYARIIEEERNTVNAGIFWPIAERFHLVEDLDKHMLKLALVELQNNKELMLTVNLSPQSVQSATFRQWLGATLTENPGVKRLSLELPERILRRNEKDLEELLAITQTLGIKVGLDHFGLVPSALGSLQKLPLNYVKIDQQFIHDHIKQAYYLKTLCQIAHASDVQAIVEGVETEEQWLAALEAGAQAAQGYWLAKPASER